jgi:hypothetical protein
LVFNQLSPDSLKAKPALRLIQGGRFAHMHWDSLRIVAAGRRSQPFPVQAHIVAEDTYLIMSAQPQSAEPAIHPIRLMTEMLEVKPLAPGSVRIRTRDSMQILTVIYDVDAEPICSEEWIRQGLHSALATAEAHAIRALALPVLGRRYAAMDGPRFAAILHQCLLAHPRKFLQRIWLISSGELKKSLIDELKDLKPAI